MLGGRGERSSSSCFIALLRTQRQRLCYFPKEWCAGLEFVRSAVEVMLGGSKRPGEAEGKFRDPLLRDLSAL